MLDFIVKFNVIFDVLLIVLFSGVKLLVFLILFKYDWILFVLWLWLVCKCFGGCFVKLLVFLVIRLLIFWVFIECEFLKEFVLWNLFFFYFVVLEIVCFCV